MPVKKMSGALTFAIAIVAVVLLDAGSLPMRARGGMVISASRAASEVGAGVMKDGGNAIDAAVATAFALAVTHPVAGNIGGGGFLVFRSASGDAVAYDFREVAPSGSSPTMFLKNAKYDADLHHNSYLSVGVPGTVAGLYLAWQDHGRLPWKQLVDPAVRLAREGFAVSAGLADSLAGVLDQMKRHPASLAQFSKNGAPYEPGDILKQPDLANTLDRIARQGPPGFYEGETARLIEADMKAHGGLARAAISSRLSKAPHAPSRNVSRIRRLVGAAAKLGGHHAPRDAEHARRVRSEGGRARLRQKRPPHRRGDASRVRRSCPLPG